MDPLLFFRGTTSRRPARAIARLDLDSIGGRRLEGLLVSIPYLPDELLENQSMGIEAINDAIKMCQDFGAKIVGLGAVSAMIGGQGKVVAEASQLPITSGNTLTTYTAIQTVELALEATQGTRTLTLIGPPGPVANGLMHTLAHRGHDILVYAQRTPRPLQNEIEATNRNGYGRITVTDDLTQALGRHRLTVAASSTGGRLKTSTCPMGSLVIDVAAPSDVIHDAVRPDILVLDGELIRPPLPLRGGIWRTVYGAVTGQPRSIFACFAEPMLLALSDAGSGYVGRRVSPDAVNLLGNTAHEHGFLVDGFHRQGRPLSRAELLSFSTATA